MIHVAVRLERGSCNFKRKKKAETKGCPFPGPTPRASCTPSPCPCTAQIQKGFSWPRSLTASVNKAPVTRDFGCIPLEEMERAGATPQLGVAQHTPPSLLLELPGPDLGGG